MTSDYEKITIAYFTKPYKRHETKWYLSIITKYNSGSKSRINLYQIYNENLPNYIADMTDFINGSSNEIKWMFEGESSIHRTDHGYIIVKNSDYSKYPNSIHELCEYPFIEALKVTIQDMKLIQSELFKGSDKILNMKYKFTFRSNKIKCLLIWMSQKKQNCVFSILDIELVFIIHGYVNQYHREREA